MSKTNEQDLIDARIHKYYETVPPSEKRLADHLLTFPGDITESSATELCELTQTSKAAATRFFSRLGYKDFSDARRQAREAKKWGAPLYQSSSQAYSPQSPDISISEHINYEQTNLQRTFEALDSLTVQAFLQAICSKKRVMIIGYRNNHFLASYFTQQLSLLRDKVTLHPQANQSVAEEMFDLGADDLLIVFGLRRRTPILEKLITLANQRECSTLLISDPTSADLQKLVTWKIICTVHSSSNLDSYTSIMSMLTLLINSVIRENPQALNRLREIESVHETLGELNELL